MERRIDKWGIYKALMIKGKKCNKWVLQVTWKISGAKGEKIAKHWETKRSYFKTEEAAQEARKSLLDVQMSKVLEPHPIFRT